MFPGISTGLVNAIQLAALHLAKPLGELLASELIFKNIGGFEIQAFGCLIETLQVASGCLVTLKVAEVLAEDGFDQSGA